MIRVAIFDDNDSLRETLAMVFDATDDLIVVGDYPDALNVVDHVQQNKPDVVLMDIDMPGRSGIEAVRLLQVLPQPPRILMLTVHEEPEAVFEAVSAGAVGYLLKKTTADRIIDALRDVAAGGAVMTPTIAAKLLSTFQKPAGSAVRPPAFDLTDKEHEVLRRLVEGDSYKLIAAHCHISMGTVRTHIVNIYQKLHVNSKSEAVARAMKSGQY
ncbi:response regulator transcription factor [Fibrella aquatilis]|uniref:Response regulator transcription factor n=1 Tax=Fibrella aquatilis TaxID=2817059 RepID=A0A939G3P6_9BACT|nr:response regulator transcription factor [Fibrella aquatilis]MBO0929421.1 response regulator transcription factor [Fibrella aquatilis]